MKIKYWGILSAASMSIPLLSGFWVGQVQATQNDDAFTDYIVDEICDTPQGDLIITCNAATTTIGGSGETLPQTGNTGTQGANELAARDKSDVQSRMEFDGWAVFSNLDYRNLDRDTTDFENGFEGTAIGLTLGADFRISTNFLVGAAFSFKESDLDLNQSSGRVETESQEWIAFSNYQFAGDFYVDGYIGTVNQDNDVRRAVNFGLIQYDAISKFDSDNVQWGLGAGYQLPVNSFALDFALRYDVGSLEIESFAEQGGDSIENLNLQYESQDVDSETLALSFNGAFNYSLKSGVLIPYARLEFVYENENDAREVNSHLVLAPEADAFVIVTDAPDEFYGRLGAGVQYIMPGGFIIYVDAESLTGHEYMNTWKLASGFRLEL